MTRITLLRCREQAGERFRTTQTSSPHPAGTGNCLRTVKLLAPDFSGASQRATVGKLLEAAAGRHLTRSGQRTARGMHWTQAIMLGKQNDPRGLTEELEQFLYTLNLLDCSTAAPVSRVCSRARSVSSPPRSGGAAASSSHNLGSSSCRHRGRRNTDQSLQTSHRCIGQGFRELVRTRRHRGGQNTDQSSQTSHRCIAQGVRELGQTLSPQCCVETGPTT